MSKQDTFSLDYDLAFNFDNVKDDSNKLTGDGSEITEINMETTLFEDPRGSADRRQSHDPSKIPTTGCRRKSERRKMVYLKGDNWWIKRNYNNNPE